MEPERWDQQLGPESWHRRVKTGELGPERWNQRGGVGTAGCDGSPPEVGRESAGDGTRQLGPESWDRRIGTGELGPEIWESWDQELEMGQDS